MTRRHKSDIPLDAAERVAQGGKGVRKNAAFKDVTTECIHQGKVVGWRVYSSEGALIRETSLKDGLKHGREFIWDEGRLQSVEPYFEGKIHGTAKQYDQKGRLIGTYKMVHGTGYDIWRSTCHGGPLSISEIFTMCDGSLHGYEWWVNADQYSVWHERHWHHGKYHGIERMWHQNGKLQRGYPKYWIENQAVTKRQYLQARKSDHTLPAFQEIENRSMRQFPVEIERLFKKTN